jgi:hypothetical protein
MAEIFNAQFNSGIDSFDFGTRVASPSAILSDADGYLSVAAGITATRSFTAITTGTVRLDFWYKATDSTAPADDTANTSIYLMPSTLGVSSANSAAFINLRRRTTASATTTTLSLSYRTGGSTTDLALHRKGAWYKIGLVVNITARTYDIYINDVMWIRGATCPNATFTDIDRFVILQAASAPDTFFDNVRLEDSYSLPSTSVLVTDDFTVGSGSVGSSSPTTSRQQHAQNWLIPTLGTYGGFTRGATGLTPDSGVKCLALATCGAEGTFEATWTAASSGNIYMGLVFRVWGGPATDAYYLFRYYSAATAGQQLRLFQSSTALQSSAGTTGGVTYSASGTYTLKVIVEGRVMRCYVNNVLQLTHTITSDATGGRGLLCEEQAGPFCDTALGSTTNRCTAFSWTGRVPTVSTTKTIGNYKANVEIGSIKELYVTDSGGATENLLWSRGIQFSHREEHDLAEDYSAQQTTVYNGTHVASYYQRGIMMSEDAQGGIGEPYVTLLRRGIHVEDNLYTWGSSLNLSPDNDLRPTRFYGNNARTCDDSGAGSSYSYTPEHDFTSIHDNVAYPVGFQALATFGSGNDVRLSAIGANNANLGTAIGGLNNKFAGDASAISFSFSVDAADTADATQYRMRRCYLLNVGSGLALSDTVLTDWRDDQKTPATLSFSTGSIKTNADGDHDTDGYNERHGWHEVTCAGGLAAFTLTTSIKRHSPAFRLHSWTNTNTQVVIGGVTGVSGTDYVIEDLGGSVGLLQLLTDPSSNTTISVEAAGTSYTDTGLALSSLLVLSGVTDTRAMSETGLILSQLLALTGETDLRSMSESALSAALVLAQFGLTDALEMVESGIAVPVAVLTGATSVQAMSESGKAVLILVLTGETDTISGEEDTFILLTPGRGIETISGARLAQILQGGRLRN